MPALLDLDVLIIDCQTTGASPAFGSVLELGWGVARASQAELSEAQAHWIRLPEGELVSRQIRKLTGYQPCHDALAIPAQEAWQRLRQTTQRAALAPSAIHYARFELAFLRDWSARFEPDAPFSLDAVCVHGIALRLYPELPRQSLRALAGYLGHSLDLARRSLGHVEATAFVWQKQCLELAARGITSWADLQAWLSEPMQAKARPKKLKYPIASERYKGLPDAPGVYRFLRRNGDVLYVGKAGSLKKRVSSHFMSRSGKAEAPEMLTQVSDIEVTVTASALEAALLENELIKSLRPPYNVQLSTNDPRVWYSNRDFSHAVAAKDHEHSIGPLPSAYALSPLHALAALLEGREATTDLRARAVGVSSLWTPEAGVFSAGWLLFVEAHELAFPLGSALNLALGVARRLLLATAHAKSIDEQLTSAPKPEGWDPERVQRHIERALAQAYQAYRRARFLSLLQCSEVVYREPGSARVRRLLVAQAETLDARDATQSELVSMSEQAAAGGAALFPFPREPADAEPFDRTKYDRLRILTTELKRVARDGGEVALAKGGRRLPAPLLPGLLRLV